MASCSSVFYNLFPTKQNESYPKCELISSIPVLITRFVQNLMLLLKHVSGFVIHSMHMSSI